MPSTDPAKQLARQIASLQRQVQGISRASQMRYRSIENGAIPIYDADGTQRGTVGVLPDGTTGLQTQNDPRPPTPSAPILEPDVGGLKVTWDGTFEGGALRPGDFRRVEIHAAPQSVYTPSEITHVADFITSGTVAIRLPADPYTVVFVAVTTGGSRSLVSLSATETPTVAPTSEEVAAARQAAQDAQDAANAAQADADAAAQQAADAAGLVAGKSTVYIQDTAPAQDDNGLWIDTANGNVAKKWDATAADWVEVQDASIQAAAQQAAAAQAAADAAQSQADTALQQAQAAQADATSALDKATAAQTTADGKNTVFWRTDADPPPNPVITGDLWFVTDLGNRPRKYDGAAWVDASFEDGAIANLNVGKLVSGEIAAGQRIIAGPESSAHAEMHDLGFSTFAVDPGSGTVYEATRMGSGSDRFTSVDAAGNTTINIDASGKAIVQDLSVANDPSLNGKLLSEWLDALPKGIVGSSFKADVSIPRQIATRYGLGEVSFVSRVGRNYKATVVLPHIWTDVAGTRALVSLRSTVDGTAPTINSPVLDSFFFHLPVGADYVDTPPTLTAHGTFTDVDGAVVRIIPCIESFDGGGQIGVGCFPGTDFYRPLRMFVEDIGLDIPDTYIDNTGGGQLSGGTPTSPPPASKTTYTVQWDATWSKSYKADGSPRTDTTDLYQGYGDSFNGRNASLAGFDSASIRSYLAGAVINNVELYLYAEHWWNYSGGTAQIGLHGWDAPVANANGTTLMYWGNVGQYHFGRGEGAWFSIPSSLWGGWADGTYRGICFNAPDDSAVYYGRFSGAPDPTHPLVRITFTK